jgi:adenylate kinase
VTISLGARKSPDAKREAILLLGPTGSGKSPLGLELERHGLRGRRCVHFDFGANLREVAALKKAPTGFTKADMRVIRDSLRTGALLENESFPIAEKILAKFGRRRRIRKGDLLVLNGLPRHVGQARDLERTVRVRRVVYLDASLPTIRERIRRDTGGDRSGRVDDSPAEILQKYEAFQKRTTPLLAYYRRHGARIVKLEVGPETKTLELLAALPRPLVGKSFPDPGITA